MKQEPHPQKNRKKMFGLKRCWGAGPVPHPAPVSISRCLPPCRGPGVPVCQCPGVPVQYRQPAAEGSRAALRPPSSRHGRGKRLTRTTAVQQLLTQPRTPRRARCRRTPG
ncbi:unnamed protein product, partial [Coccothraustes coccothraustes]